MGWFVPYDASFFNLFGVLCTSSDPDKSQGFISFKHHPKMWMQYIDSYRWNQDDYFLVMSRIAEAHNFLCVVNRSESEVIDDLSDTVMRSMVILSPALLVLLPKVSRKLRERMLARHVPSLRVAVMMV
jgi:hypothetical protein